MYRDSLSQAASLRGLSARVAPLSGAYVRVAKKDTPPVGQSQTAAMLVVFNPLIYVVADVAQSRRGRRAAAH